MVDSESRIDVSDIDEVRVIQCVMIQSQYIEKELVQSEKNNTLVFN